MSQLANELLLNIYTFLPYGKERLATKQIYTIQQQRAVDEFYTGIPTDTSCGHRNCTKCFKWKIGGIEKTLKCCDRCFAMTIHKYVVLYKQVPSFTSSYDHICKYIKNMRKCTSRNMLLNFVYGQKYQNIDNIVFDTDPAGKYQTIYDTDCLKRSENTSKIQKSHLHRFLYR